MRASLMTLVGAAIVLAASLTGASAQVLNLTGQFQCVRLCLAAPPAFAYLTQADWELNLVKRSRRSLACLDRLSGSHLGGSLERGRVLFVRWYDHSIRQRFGMAARCGSTRASAGDQTPLPALSSDCVERLIVGCTYTRNAKSGLRLTAQSGFFISATLSFATVSQAAFTSIFLAAFCASTLFGSATLRTPFLKVASILSVSTPSGTWNER